MNSESHDTENVSSINPAVWMCSACRLAAAAFNKSKWGLRAALVMIILSTAPTTFAQLRGSYDPLQRVRSTFRVDSEIRTKASLIYAAAKAANNLPPAIKLEGLKGGPTHDKPLARNDEQQATLPHWSGKFSYDGVAYDYTMIGTDPANGSATTVIPTEIIALRLVFANGIVLDPSVDTDGGVTILQSVINSPIFQSTNFSAGPTRLGYTQFGDAFQRADFWSLVSSRAPEYHVLLGQPRVFLQTLVVPVDKGTAGTLPGLTGTIGVLDSDWFDQQLQQVIATLGIDPSTLPIFITHNSAVFLPFGAELGYHNLIAPSTQGHPQRGVQTYILASYFENLFVDSVPLASDVDVLSHEVSEWIADPFLNNLILPFVNPEGFSHCEGFHLGPDGPLVGLLEVGDPIETPAFPEIPVNLGGMTYHLQDEVFLSWFARQSPSTAVNGYYSFANALQSFAQLCANVTDYTFTSIDVPNSEETHLTGINNKGKLVGWYIDLLSGLPRGFVWDNGTFNNVDVPDAYLTEPWKINDTGEIVGYYYDAAFHLHGFLLHNGTFQTLDAPGAIATFALGINNQQEIVGGYLGADRRIHGFIQSGAQFRTVDVPFAFEDDIEAINDSDEVIGDYDTGNVDDNFGFIGRPNRFQPLMFPGSFLTSPHSINGEREVVGWYYYPVYGELPLFSSGFIKNGQTYTRILAFFAPFSWPMTLDGNNDAGQVVGTYLDGFNGFTPRGVIVTPKKGP